MKYLHYYLCFIAIFLLIIFTFFFISLYREREEQEELIKENNELKLKNKQLGRDNYILKREIKENKEDE